MKRNHSAPTMKINARNFSDLTVKKSCASLEQPVFDFTDTMNLQGELYFLLCFALNSEPNMELALRTVKYFLGL